MEESTPTPQEAVAPQPEAQDVDVAQAAEVAQKIIDTVPAAVEATPAVVPSTLEVPQEEPSTITVINGVPGPNGEPAPTIEVSATPAPEQFLGASNAHLQSATQLASPANLGPMPEQVAPQPESPEQTAL